MSMLLWHDDCIPSYVLCTLSYKKQQQQKKNLRADDLSTFSQHSHKYDCVRVLRDCLYAYWPLSQVHTWSTFLLHHLSFRHDLSSFMFCLHDLSLRHFIQSLRHRCRHGQYVSRDVASTLGPVQHVESVFGGLDDRPIKCAPVKIQPREDRTPYSVHTAPCIPIPPVEKGWTHKNEDLWRDCRSRRTYRLMFSHRSSDEEIRRCQNLHWSEVEFRSQEGTLHDSNIWRPASQDQRCHSVQQTRCHQKILADTFGSEHCPTDDVPNAHLFSACNILAHDGVHSAGQVQRHLFQWKHSGL